MPKRPQIMRFSDIFSSQLQRIDAEQAAEAIKMGFERKCDLIAAKPPKFPVTPLFVNTDIPSVRIFGMRYGLHPPLKNRWKKQQVQRDFIGNLYKE